MDQSFFFSEQERKSSQAFFFLSAALVREDVGMGDILVCKRRGVTKEDASEVYVRKASMQMKLSCKKKNRFSCPIRQWYCDVSR